VQERVETAKHSIPEDVIRRQYDKGRKNLTSLYLPLCDTPKVYNNSMDTPQLIAKSRLQSQSIIYEIKILPKIIEG
jgi:predicted ABC-type ATPase